MTCSVEGCGHKITVKGFCKRHYYAERRSGRLNRTVARNDGPCSVDGCDRPASKKTLCGPHYKRLWKTGDVRGHGKAMWGEGEKWLRDHVGHQGASCLEWPFGRSKSGYGQVCIDGHEAPASRHMAQIIHGRLPNEVHVRHTCDNPPCCNPNHLVLGSALDNHRDSVERARHVPPPWKPGEDNGAAKLTAAQVKEIRRRLEQETGRSLARQFGVSESSISRIRREQGWRHASAS